MTRSSGTRRRGCRAQRRNERRGEELESALLDAAWDELQKVGYARLTFEAIATGRHQPRGAVPALAQTARPGVAAMRRHRPMLSGEVPDTGSLRDDVLTVLRRMSGRLADPAPRPSTA